ncbi:serine hydrolase [Cecembia sp.]|uniref:serine hydrolase n=1 Tax=Cecembia sp. TaxID=1898110 RepID=UPI0025BDED32|nr:serine hydrolase [Cecembia sp.]
MKCSIDFNLNLFKIASIISIALFSSCNSRINKAEEIQELNLENELAALIKDFKGEAHLYAKNLTTGEIINIDGERTHLAASEAKFFILLDYAEKVSNGTLDPATPIKLTEEDKTLGSGILRFEIPGNEVSLSFLAYLMMSISDNTATNILLREVGGPKAITSFLNKIGIDDTKVDGEVSKGDWIKTSAKSLATAAEVLAAPEKFGYPKEAVEICKKIMSKHYEDNGLARFLPWSPFTEEAKSIADNQKYIQIYAGIELYGKAGFTTGYRGDVAYFITPDSEYVIGLKCTDVDDSKPLNATNEGFEFSAKLGKLFYDHWGIPATI